MEIADTVSSRCKVSVCNSARCMGRADEECVAEGLMQRQCAVGRLWEQTL
jgi:hypothetical protein